MKQKTGAIKKWLRKIFVTFYVLLKAGQHLSKYSSQNRPSVSFIV